MPGRIWQTTPQRSVERECQGRGRIPFAEACCRMLDGDDSDPGLIVALGGPPGQALIDRGLPPHLRYWLRVWAARGLFWAWDDLALPQLIEAGEDEHWRVREWVGKIAGRYALPRTREVLERLVHDDVPRVRTAAVRALGVLGDD
ncbi:HEAT repeat domain-containing protein [Mycolicibacterium sediminis]|uniref:HEAT repeat domain-containing protein n=1 Tax=Mycolicibacterium sediminis TaxID=1286180 RepID=A0A7I7QM75_9MYCO|nr:HEAT repeat domain-containing protein [Mycolicibacterium sediminis]BBY26986.1 hypothetical protein MSEDJ_10820 [Mycolicibacterium sediminis]